MESLIFIVFLFAIVWLVFLMPTRRRQKAHQAMQESVGLGDEIITAGGLHGFVRETGDDELRVEIAPDVVVRLDRRAIAAVARDLPAEGERAAGDEPAEVEPDEALVEARDPADRGS